jgi:hypothetical protein
MKTRTISRYSHDRNNFGVRTSYIIHIVEGNYASYRLLHEIYQRICTDHKTNGKVTKEGRNFLMERGILEGLGHLKVETCDPLILIFLYWKKEFHVHVDASSIVLGALLSQLGEGDIDHQIDFVSRKLSIEGKNYSTTKQEGLDMVYALQKFMHYLLGSHFKMYTNLSSLKYLVNNPLLGGRICRWLLLFQKYDFEVIMKPWKMNT